MKTDSILIFLTFFFFFCITAVDASAQEMVPEGYQIVDSVIYRPAAVMDSTLVGKDIFNHVSSNVTIWVYTPKLKLAQCTLTKTATFTTMMKTATR